MKNLFLIILITSFTSCNSDEQTTQAVQLNSTIPSTAKPKIDPFKSASGNSLKAEDDFSDLKELDKKDESCDSPEEMEKKLLEKAQRPVLLQGGDEGCAVE